MYKTTILWGERPERGDLADTYTFNTKAELDAFLMGVEEAGGWLNYSFEEEGFSVPTDHEAYEEFLENRESQL